jgi:hypothetical protein
MAFQFLDIVLLLLVLTTDPLPLKAGLQVLFSTNRAIRYGSGIT